jgi:hypothetical protein
MEKQSAATVETCKAEVHLASASIPRRAAECLVAIPSSGAMGKSQRRLLANGVQLAFEPVKLLLEF